MKAQSKIGSLDNVKYRPGGGDKKIFDDKDYLRQMSGTTSKAGSEGIPSGSQVIYNQRKHKNWASSETLTYTSSHSLDNVAGKRKAISESSVIPQSIPTNLPASSFKLHTNEFDLLPLVDSPTDSFYNSPTSSTHEERDRDVRYVNNNLELFSDENFQNGYNGSEMLPKNQYSKSSFDLKDKEVSENSSDSDSFTGLNQSKPESDQRNTPNQPDVHGENNNNLLPSSSNHETNLYYRNSGENDVIVSEDLSQEKKTKSHGDIVDDKPAGKSEPFDLYDINQLFQDNFNRSKTRSPDSVRQVSKQFKENHIRHEGEDSVEQMFDNDSKSDKEHLKVVVSITNNIQDKEVETGVELQGSAETVQQLLNNFNVITGNNKVSESDAVLVSSLNSPDKLSGYMQSATSSSSTESPEKHNRSQSNSDGQAVTNNKVNLFGSVLSMNSNVESDKASLTEAKEHWDSKKFEIVPRLMFDENKNSSISSPEPLPRSVDFCKSNAKREAIVFSLGQSSLVIYKNEAGNEVLQIFKRE